MPQPPPSIKARREAYLHGRVVTAARSGTVGLDADGEPLPARLRSGAASTALNVAAILRETWEDFRNADRYFKYKAIILAAWGVLSVLGIGVACPGPSVHRDTSLGARLVVGEETEHPALVLHNESDAAWQEVMIIVNGRFRAAISHVEPHAFVTVTPKQLMGDNGKLAPSDLRFTDVELRTRKGSAVLLEAGTLR
ncbi:MAG TPA: hypothetical protein VEJ89_10080 [Myxococcaceae bacterium]|nr:hypothetical protein [Myxococcaceae bacterium]